MSKKAAKKPATAPAPAPATVSLTLPVTFRLSGPAKALPECSQWMKAQIPAFRAQIRAASFHHADSGITLEVDVGEPRG